MWCIISVLAVALLAWKLRKVTQLVKNMESTLHPFTQVEQDKFQTFLQIQVKCLETEMKLAISKQQQDTVRVLEQDRTETLRKMSVHRNEVEEAIKKSKADFKYLLDNAYLAEYEKMKQNPPRPKKGPRNRVDAPKKYRSLDDD